MNTLSNLNEWAPSSKLFEKGPRSALSIVEVSIILVEIGFSLAITVLQLLFSTENRTFWASKSCFRSICPLSATFTSTLFWSSHYRIWSSIIPPFIPRSSPFRPLCWSHLRKSTGKQLSSIFLYSSNNFNIWILCYKSFVHQSKFFCIHFI